MSEKNIIYSKHKIFPNVVVYKNLFADIQKTLSVIKNSESLTEQFYISKWTNWGDFGRIAKTESEKVFYEQNFLGEDAERQRDIVSELFENYNLAIKDYVLECRDSLAWPEYVDNFNVNEYPWVGVRADILKYDLSARRWNMALHYHVDQNRWEEQMGGQKFVLTTTTYLSDNYEGGEISFLNNETNEILTYKPEAGDIVVFPSFYPYHHGVLPVTSGEKYLIRMFHKWDYQGSKEWQDKKNQYGIEELRRMDKEFLDEKERIGREKMYDQEIPDPSYDVNVIILELSNKEYVKKYINGKDLS